MKPLKTTKSDKNNGTNAAYNTKNGNDKNDVEKYIFNMKHFERLPRWSNDGIEQFRQGQHQVDEETLDVDDSNNNNTNKQIHPVQRVLTDLMGTWLADADLQDLDRTGADFALSLPYQIQKSEAQKQQDLVAAEKYLLEAYPKEESNNTQDATNDNAVGKLLEDISCKEMVHKATVAAAASSRSEKHDDNRLLPPLENIIAPLLQKRLASDANLELLFGDAARVRGILFEFGPMIAAPPPTNSPAGTVMSNVLGKNMNSHQQQGRDVSLSDENIMICAECGATRDTLLQCLACKSIHYCGRDCQKKNWPLHRPDCFKIQGKPVSSAIMGKAERAKQARAKAAQLTQKQKASSEHMRARNKSFDAFLEEGPDKADQYMFDCYGKRLLAHLPEYGVEITDLVLMGEPRLILKFEQRLSLGMFPDGIDSERYSFRGTLYSDPANRGAKMIFLFVHLYESVEPCDCTGYAIDGIFVIDKVKQKRAEWKLVPNPSRDPSWSRLEFIAEYFLSAKRRAKAVDEDVDLGIHNPGDPSLVEL